MNKKIIEKLARIQEDSHRISGLNLFMEHSSERLLSRELPIGFITWELPDVIFKESLEEIKKRIKDIAPEVPIEIAFSPFSETKMRILYHKWRKN